MPLSNGTRLGPYEIVSPIGAGGMGEVYRARDTKLGREVALKVLPEAFACDTDRMARFGREAQVLASVNHPHIATMYGLEEAGSLRALVMELVEGTQLKGPLPLPQAVEYAGQILDALDAAHRKGITHRDLKPTNILVTRQGIKLLDFGLAKQSGPMQEGDATLTAALTRKGEILGTLQYMSPEQLQGKEADARSDLFSFGCVLYEMLTGKRAFEGQSTASVIAAILEREPAPLNVAPPLGRVITTCLAKDPDQRFQNARDLKRDLVWALEQPPVATPAKGMSRRSWVVAGALAAALGVALWAPWHAKPAPQPPMRLDVDLGSDVSLGSAMGGEAILSPDGTRLVYCSQSRLFTRRLDQSTAAELAGTDEAYAPFFSPDGQWVGFFVPGGLKKVSVQGGAAIVLCNAPNGFGGSWGEDGNIIATLSGIGGLSRIPAAGGAPAPVTTLAPGESAHRWPQILPGGKAVLFTAYTSPIGLDGATIDVISSGGRRKTLQQGGTYGRYLPSGHLVYLNHGTLFAQPFDLDRLELRGAPVPVIGDVAHNSAFGNAQFDFSSSAPGTFVYRTGGPGVGLMTVQWLDGAGQTRPLLAKPGDYLAPSLSPDGNRLAVTSAGGVWVYESRRDIMTHVTFGGGHSYPVWTPDGRYIVFQAREGMSWVRADGSGKPQVLIQGTNAQFPFSFAADGKRLAFMELSPQTGFDLWTVPVESDGSGLRAGKAEVFLQTSFDERHPALSPDSRWLAYSSNESGTFQVYVRAFSGGTAGAKWQISNGSGVYPSWSPHTRELFFRTMESQIMVAAYKVEGDAFVAAKPRLWSEKRLANVGLWRNYDVAPDGKRIAAMMPAEGSGGQVYHHVIFLLNFFDELRRRAPTSR